MRRAAATIAVLIGLGVAAVTPANAATTGWVNGTQTRTLGGCVVNSGNSSKVAWADENPSDPCSGSVGVRARVATGNSVTTTRWKYHSLSAVIAVGSASGVISHQARH